ncbi:MAG: peptide deformylase [Bacteroidota bacterium]
MLKYSIFFLALYGLLSSCTSTKKLSQSATQSSFSKAQQELILRADRDTPMRVFKITNQQDSILLRTKSEDVAADPNDPILQTFVKRLYSTVRDSMSLGVGIAAPQVGILKNIIWVQRFDKADFPFEVYLNPKILQYTKKKQDCMEGCLSIPDRRDLTQDRAYAILIEYDQLNGEHKIEMVEDFTAVIFQHEIDHLNGILYLDHLEKEIKDSEK